MQSYLARARADALLALIEQMGHSASVRGVLCRLKDYGWTRREVEAGIDLLVSQRRIELRPLTAKWAPWIATIVIRRRVRA